MENITLINIVGLRYPTPKSKTRRMYGNYLCFCGNTFIAQKYKVDIGHTKSCGCLKKLKASKLNNTHNMSNHILYRVWSNMMQRCYNIKNKNFEYYGGRGIVVDIAWHNIDNFIYDMYPSFQKGLTLDRINNNLGYSRDNCRWVNQSTQSRNIRVIRSNNTSKFKGVSYNKNSNKYTAQISIKGIKIHLGTYENALEAALVYDNYIIINNLEHTKNFN